MHDHLYLLAHLVHCSGAWAWGASLLLFPESMNDWSSAVDDYVIASTCVLFRPVAPRAVADLYARGDAALLRN